MTADTLTVYQLSFGCGCDYIGQSNDHKRRIEEHRWAPNPNPSQRLIRAHIRAGHKPDIEVLAVLPHDEALAKHRDLVAAARQPLNLVGTDSLRRVPRDHDGPTREPLWLCRSFTCDLPPQPADRFDRRPVCGTPQGPCLDCQPDQPDA